MLSATPSTRDLRWIVLAPDGRTVTLGRHSDPSEAEILAAEASLQNQGIGGWLAVMEGNPYTGPKPRFLEVRQLGQPSVPFAVAAETATTAMMRFRGNLDDTAPKR